MPRKKAVVESVSNKMTIGTNLFKDMVSRANKGVGNNKLIPLTSMMAIQLVNNKLTLITSDAINYLYVMEDKVEGNDFYVVVQADQFSKLISKLTCEYITMQLEDNKLNISGNGKYSIELPLDENGELIKYPDPSQTVELEGEGVEFNLSTANLMLSVCKPSLAITLENPFYTGYYVGDRVLATDTFKICSLNINLFDKPVLLPVELVDLFNVMTSEKISAYITSTDVVFKTPDCWIYGKPLEGIEYYQADVISEALDQEFNSVCKIAKDKLLELLDRIALFVGWHDDRAVRLTFTENGLNVQSMQLNSSESVEFSQSSDFKPMTCLADVDMLIQQIKANQSDMLEIHYGDSNDDDEIDSALKFVDGNVTQIISLLNESDLEG